MAAARTNMFLSRMMQQEGAGGAAPKGGVQSAPVTPPSADSGGSARSLPTAAGAGGDAGRSGGDGLSASQPLAGAAAGFEAEAPRPLPGTPPPAAGAAWEEPIAGGRDAPGMRYEIYDLSTAQLRQEMAVCQQRLQGGGAAEWQAWGGWISEELDERLAGEDILSAIATIQGEGDPFDDDNDGRGQVGGGGGGAVVLDQRSDSVLSTSVSQPASASPKTLRVKMRRGAPQGHSEAEYRRAAAAELNRTAGGARRNRAKKLAPAWASGKADPPVDEEPPAADKPLSPQRQQPQPQPQPEAQPEPRKHQAPGAKKKKKRADKPERAARPAPKASAGPAAAAAAAGAAAQAAAPAPAPAAASPLRASGAAEPAIRRSTEEMSEALEVRSASLDQRMEEERQQLWLQQQAAQAEVERIAREEEQQRQEQEQRRLAEQAERQEAERLARQLEEKKKREEAQLRERLDAERRQKEKQQQERQAAERRRKAEEEEAQRQAAEVKRRAAEAEERRAAEAAEIEQLEAESKRRMEEARQIKLAMMVRTIHHSSSQAAVI